MINNKWYEYNEIDGKASYQLDKAVEKEYRGKGFRLSDFFDVYDWEKDNGYNNFSMWVKE